MQKNNVVFKVLSTTKSSWKNKTLKKLQTYLENRAKTSMAKFVKVGEEIGGDLERTEVEEEVKSVMFR